MTRRIIMKHHLKWILLLSCGLSSAVSAGNMLDKIGIEPSVKPISQEQTLKTNLPTAINFSGQWQGQCDDGMEADIDIQQDSLYITMDGQEYALGAQNIYTKASKAASTTMDILVDWNEEHSALILNGIKIYRGNPPNVSINFSKTKLFLDNKKLIIKGQHIFSDNFMEGVEKDNYICTFDKIAIHNL